MEQKPNVIGTARVITADGKVATATCYSRRSPDNDSEGVTCGLLRIRRGLAADVYRSSSKEGCGHATCYFYNAYLGS